MLGVTPVEIEHATLRTWPAAVIEEHCGWFYLADSGVTGRVNAVWPLAWDGGSLEAAIAQAEAWYLERGLAPCFKLTEGAFAPAELPAALAQRGYRAMTSTLVMALSLTTRTAVQDDVTLSDTMPPAFEQMLRESAGNEAEFAERRGIALRAPQPKMFALARRDGRVAAIGMSTIAGDLVGIVLMRTHAAARRQGHARRILTALLAHAADNGARGAFLQVEADNAPAIALYERFGFTTLSTYHYWRR